MALSELIALLSTLLTSDKVRVMSRLFVKAGGDALAHESDLVETPRRKVERTGRIHKAA